MDINLGDYLVPDIQNSSLGLVPHINNGFTYTVIPDNIQIAYSIIQVSLKIHEVLAVPASSTAESAQKKSSGPLLIEEKIEE